ncbi:threonine synthase, partial [archaeon]|nr:threonine synthase [archaeon]
MHATNFACFNCRRKFPLEPVIFECPECRSSIDIEYDYKKIKELIFRQEFLRNESINHWKYWMFYPLKSFDNLVSLRENATPLIESKNFKDYLFKFEGTNVTGSFKDRGSAIEINKALELGVKEVYCATTGNMGASISAYAARAGIKANIFVPGIAPKSKIEQIKAYGARIFKVKGTYQQAAEQTLELRRRKGIYLVGDYPFRLEGTKSVGFEIIDQLNWKVPENIVCPIGNGTLIYAVFKACSESMKVGLTNKMPKIIGVQVKGCNPVYLAWKKKLKEVPFIRKPKTIVDAVACGKPVDGLQALHAMKESRGYCVEVADAETVKAKKLLASEGIYAELGGSVALAGALKAGVKGKT